MTDGPLESAGLRTHEHAAKLSVVSRQSEEDHFLDEVTTMTSNKNLDALFSDAELPFGHPGRNFEDSPSHFDRFDDRHEPRSADPPGEGIVHYGPGNRPLCGEEDELALHTEDPHKVVGCADCAEIVAEDLQDHNDYRGRCLHCRQEIIAHGGVEWRRTVRRPCTHCGKAGW